MGFPLDHWRNLGSPLESPEKLEQMTAEGNALREECWKAPDGAEVNGEIVSGRAMLSGYRDGIEPGLPVGSKRAGFERIF